MITVDYPVKKFLKNLDRVEPFIMDSTAYRTLTDCRRKYFYRIVLGRVPKQKDKNEILLSAGKYYHKFREILELRGYAEAMRYLLSVSLPDQDPKEKYSYLDNQRLLLACQVAYEHWQNEKEKKIIEVVAVEQPFNVEIVPDVWSGGRVDQLIKYMGKLWDRDFKFTSKDKVAFERSLSPNDQAIRYIVGLSVVHVQEIQGVMFQAMYNTKTVKPNIYTSNSTRNSFQKSTWVKEIEFNSRQLKIMREEDIWPMDTGRGCAWCPYHKICNLSSEPSMEAVLKSDYKFSPWDHEHVDQEEE